MMGATVSGGNRSQKYDVTPIELLFDLIFAFALSQVTEVIVSELTWLTVVKGLILLSAIYMVWSYTSWAATMIPAESSKSQRMIISVMFIGFFMITSIESAFEKYAVVFVGTYLVIQLGRTLWTLLNSPNEKFKEHFIRVLIWQLISTPLWVAGATYGENIRIMLWMSAVVIDILGTWTAHPLPMKRFHSEHLEFDASHLLERCRLFRIIALGEMVFFVGDALIKAHYSYMTIVLCIVALAEILSLWMLTFGRFVSVIAKHRENATDPVLVSRYAINDLVIILFGIVFISVGLKFIILNPYDRVPMVLTVLLGGGFIMFLLAQEWYLRMVPKIRQKYYVISAAILFVANITGVFLPAWLYHLTLGVPLIIIAFSDFYLYERAREKVRE